MDELPATSWRTKLIRIGLVLVLAILQSLPAARLAWYHRDIPLPLAIGAANFIVVPIILSGVEWLTARRLAILPRLLIAVCLASVAGGTIASGLWSGIIPNVVRSLPPGITPVETLSSSFMFGALMSVLVIGAWSLAVVFPRIIEQQRIRALQLANLELEAAELRLEGELARLRGQLEPHFLLNTLNLIAGLVTVDATKARQTLVNLGALLRDTLEEHGETQTIAEEVQWLERYCEILEVRHGPSLRITWDIEESAKSTLIPRQLLQPVVENALVHGALRASDAGRVHIRIYRESSKKVVCVIEDNGPGASGVTRKGAVGLDNVRRRLELSSPKSSFRLENMREGTRATIELEQLDSVNGQEGES